MLLVPCDDVVGGGGEGDDVVVVEPHGNRDSDDVAPAVIIPIFLLAIAVAQREKMVGWIRLNLGQGWG
jgi:hypothetical protein